MPHSAQSVHAAASTEAAQRARTQATVVTCAAATVPTVLAMQGMASLATDLLHFPVAVAIALVSFALLTRASALAGRPGGVDAAAVWGGVARFRGVLRPA
jgi:Na+(H+)/acetate symporter ActP